MASIPKIPLADVTHLHASIEEELYAAYQQVVGTSAFVGPATSAEFEHDFASAHGAVEAAGCGSGTDALTLALRATGVRPGDEVIAPAMTFVATAEAIVHAGATPVLADVDPVTLLLTSESVDAVRTHATRAVVPVHLYGHTVDFDLLRRWRAEGLVVIEDAAQAHLASWRGEPVGAVGHAACFSFYPGKNLGALGDGGLVLSRDPDVVERVRQLRDHGRQTGYRHAEIGWCSRLDGLQAAFLRVKLRHLARWTEVRRQRAARYSANVPGNLLVPWEEGAVHHLMVARIGGGLRDEVRASLDRAGIETGMHYPVALSDQPALARWARPCPNAERAASEVLSLPMHPLLTERAVDTVCGALVSAARSFVIAESA